MVQKRTVTGTRAGALMPAPVCAYGRVAIPSRRLISTKAAGAV